MSYKKMMQILMMIPLFTSYQAFASTSAQDYCDKAGSWEIQECRRETFCSYRGYTNKMLQAGTAKKASDFCSTKERVLDPYYEAALYDLVVDDLNDYHNNKVNRFIPKLFQITSEILNLADCARTFGFGPTLFEK